MGNEGMEKEMNISMIGKRMENEVGTGVMKGHLAEEKRKWAQP